MKPAEILSGIFTNSAEYATVHRSALAGVGEDVARTQFTLAIDRAKQERLEKSGNLSGDFLRRLYFDPCILLPEHFSVPRFGNLIASVHIPRELVERLSLQERQRVDVQIRASSYSPARGLRAIAARTDNHPDWVYYLDR